MGSNRVTGLIGGALAASAVVLLLLPAVAGANVVDRIDVSCTPPTYTGTAQLGGTWGGGKDVTQTIAVDGTVRVTAVVRVTAAGLLTLSAPVTDALEHVVTYRVSWAGNGSQATRTLTCGTTPPPPAPPTPPAPPATPPAGPPADVLATAPAVGEVPAAAQGAVPPSPAPPAPAVAASSAPAAGRSACPAPVLAMGVTGPRQLDAGQQVTFGFLVGNTGRNPAPGTVLVYPVPSGLSFVSAEGAGPVRSAGARERVAGAAGVSGSSLRLALGTIPPRSSRRVSVVMRVDRSAAGVRVNRARVASAACGARAAAVIPIRIRALLPAVTPAVTG